MSIQIGRHIQAVLKADAVVRQSFGNRYYPVVIPMSAPKYPFIVYTLLNTSADDATKDGNASDSAQVALIIVHKDYDQGISLSNRVRYLFEGVSASYPYMQVKDCQMTGYREDWDDAIGAFIYILNFNFNTVDL